jgi:membrane protease YdiL (CAAX protease family)
VAGPDDPLAVTAAQLLGAGDADLGRVDLLSLAMWAGASVLAAPVFLGEELGWRGYLQVRIFPGRRLLAATVTGVVWAVWHFPLWLIVLELPTWVLALATGSTIVTSVFLGWLQERSGSVWAPAVGHSTNNTFEAGFGAVAFTGGSRDIWLPLGPSLAIVAAEAVVLLSAVAVSSRRRERSERSAATVAGPDAAAGSPALGSAGRGGAPVDCP